MSNEKEGDNLLMAKKVEISTDHEELHHGSGHPVKKKSFAIFLLLMQAAFIIIFGLMATYEHVGGHHEVEAEHAEMAAHHGDNMSLTHDEDLVHAAESKAENHGHALTADDLPKLAHYYGMFQDVHVMIFIGFGFLMTFLKRYGFTAVSLNLLLAAFVLEWHTLLLGLFEMEPNNTFHVGITHMILSEFCAGAVLISMGAVLGKVSPIQYCVMAFFEVIFFTVNEYIFLMLNINDVGGSMNLHAFGAYFGLMIARILYDKKTMEHHNEGSVYHSDVLAMIGTIFLWMFWPSFNAALVVPDDAQNRAVINTYFSLAACTLVAFAASSAFQKHAKLDMVHIQNATLAGGVAIGTAANLIVTPFGSMIVGSVAGLISTAGYVFLLPILRTKLKLHDTCGVHNLHGMPGILGGIVGIVVSAVATEEQYGDSLTEVFPARAADADVLFGHGRTANMQAAIQALGLAMALGIALVGGLITGCILKLKIWQNLQHTQSFFTDEVAWEVPDDYHKLEGE